MKNRWLIFGLALLALAGWGWAAQTLDKSTGGAALATGTDKKVYILPIREDIMPPLLYLVRRGVKEAMEAKADLLVLDMDTDGGRVDVTMKIIEIVGQFKGETATFVNKKAFSAGSFISVGTQKIYMAPQSVIGAAAPIMLSPGGSGVEQLPATMEAKMVSAVKALVRATADKNGHNAAVIEAMIDKNSELEIDGKVLNKKGDLLTLTNVEAEKEYGTPPKRLLSAGTVKDIDEMLASLGYKGATQTRVQPLGAEKLAIWINALSPLLLIIGIGGIYIEMKTPGFGLPGIIGISAFALYFFGGYVAGLAGMELLLVFILGLGLVVVELFVFPGTLVLGLAGAVLMLASIIMALVDVYPGMPTFTLDLQFREGAFRDLMLTVLGSIGAVWILSKWLPNTSVWNTMVSQTASGVASVHVQEQKQKSRVGQEGVSISPLRPGGKAQFGQDIVDVVTQGEMLGKGQRVKIIGHSGPEAVVEAVKEA